MINEEATRAKAALVPPPPQDPWAHRHSSMRCSTCMFFVPKTAEGRLVPFGRCRRHAPTMAGYPAVFETDWCGDHKLDENKLGR